MNLFKIKRNIKNYKENPGSQFNHELYVLFAQLPSLEYHRDTLGISPFWKDLKEDDYKELVNHLQELAKIYQKTQHFDFSTYNLYNVKDLNLNHIIPGSVTAWKLFAFSCFFAKQSGQRFAHLRSATRARHSVPQAHCHQTILPLAGRMSKAVSVPFSVKCHSRATAGNRSPNDSPGDGAARGVGAGAGRAGRPRRRGVRDGAVRPDGRR